jgi:hypothetical protein
MNNENNVKLGEFPFPLTDGPQESKYLTWLRNHSNYMAVRGFLDYLRSFGVLVRGIVVNFLIFLPLLLFIAIGLAYCHHWMLEHPYRLTLIAMAGSVAWILLFPIINPLLKIATYKGSLQNEKRTSITLRDRYERSFSAALVVIFVTAFLESMPGILEFFLEQIRAGRFNWQGGVASVAIAVAIFSGANKLLSALSGAKKTVATIVVGLIGLLAPIAVILYAVNFMLYSPPATPLVMLSPLIMAVLYVAFIIVAIFIGLWRKAFSQKELAAVVGLLAFAMLLVYGVLEGTVLKTREIHPHDTPLNKIIAPMQHVASYFIEIPNRQALTPEIAAFVDDVIKTERDTSKLRDQIRYKAESDCFKTRYSNDWFQRWTCEQEIAQWEQQRYTAAAKYFELADKLSEISETNLDPLRKELAKLARAKLWSHLKSYADNKDCGYYVRCQDEDLVQRARRSLIFRQLTMLDLTKLDIETQQSELSGQLADPIDSKRLCNLFDADVSHTAQNVCKQFEELYIPARTHAAVQLAIEKAQRHLENISNEELSELINESDLFEQVQAKFANANVYGQAEIARLTGKEAMARLLTRKEMLCSIFYNSLACTFAPVDEKEPSETTKTPASPGDVAGSNTTKKLKPRRDFDRATKWAFLQFVLSKQRIPENNVDTLPDSPQRLDLAALATLASWKSWRPPELLDKLTSPWDRPNEFQMDRWSNNRELHREYLARVAGEYLLSNVLRSLSVNHLELMLTRLSVKWEDVDYDPARKTAKDNVEAFYVNAVNPKKRLVTPIEEIVYEVEAMKKTLLSARTKTAQAELLDHADLVMELAHRVHMHPSRLKEQVRSELMRQARLVNDRSVTQFNTNPQQALDHFENFYLKQIVTPRGKFLELRPYVEDVTSGALASLAISKFQDGTLGEKDAIDKLITALVIGEHGGLEKPNEALKKKLTKVTIFSKAIFIALLALVILVGCWLSVDVNLTSIHGLYRDRLASAFLVGKITAGNVGVDEDIDLSEICRYEARSIAPYHLINVALNLQDSNDIGIRDRNSDVFIFSKRFIGGQRTGYCRSETMQQVFPQVNLATAMAISAAAASPNMGRGTTPLLVAFMTMLNIRLGFWLPNPGMLEERLNKVLWKQRKADANEGGKPPGFTFEEVFTQELHDLDRRWGQIYPTRWTRRRLADHAQALLDAGAIVLPAVEHGLAGIGFSGGGIRSAAINLGIAQTLYQCGAFDHLDYMSTVSGGGYLGSSISALMLAREPLVSEIAGEVSIGPEHLYCDFAGTVTRIDPRETRSEIAGIVTAIKPAQDDDPAIGKNPVNKGDKIVVVKGSEDEKTYLVAGNGNLNFNMGDAVAQDQVLCSYIDVVVTPDEAGAARKVHTFSGTAELAVKRNDAVQKGQPLLKYIDVVITPPGSADGSDSRRYRFSNEVNLNVSDKDNVAAGHPLLRHWSNKNQSEFRGSVSLTQNGAKSEQIVKVRGRGDHRNQQREYRFSRFDEVIVATGQDVAQDEQLIKPHNTIGKRFLWRVRPSAFLREMRSKLDETHRWVNLSDGGHIENLATIELLRRRCKYIIIGDGEADPELHFNGLATLMRCAYIDLGISIDIKLDAIQLKRTKPGDPATAVSRRHWTIGTVTYPEKDELGNRKMGYLLYLKSSFTGDEIEVIREYRHRNPSFPHETTADQFFDEGQFEAYRALGQHIAKKAFTLDVPKATLPDLKSFADFEAWFQKTYESENAAQA